MATYKSDRAHVCATDDMPWACAPTAGVSYKSLRFDPDTGAGAVLIHMTPDTTYPRHHVHGGLDLLVIDGEVEIHGQLLERGAFAHVPPGMTQAPYTSRGCVLYATFSGKIENLHEPPALSMV